MDIVGRVTCSKNGNQYILTILEYETRFAKAFAMPDMESVTIAKLFRDHIILEHGVPSELLTDQGKNLTEGVMKELCNLLGIHKIQTTTYHPQTDGLVEKFNGTLGNMLSAYVHQQADCWDDYLQFAVFAYNTSAHASTKETPFYLMYGHDPLEPCDLGEPMRNRLIQGQGNIFTQKWRESRDLAKLHLEKAQDAQKKFYDKNNSDAIQYANGELVLLKEQRIGLGKFHFRWDGPYTIIKKLSDVNYVIRKDGSLTDIVIHINRIRKFKERNENSETNNDNINNKANNQQETVKLTDQNYQQGNLIQENRQKPSEEKGIPPNTEEATLLFLPEAGNPGTVENEEYSHSDAPTASGQLTESQAQPEISHQAQTAARQVTQIPIFPSTETVTAAGQQKKVKAKRNRQNRQTQNAEQNQNRTTRQYNFRKTIKLPQRFRE